MLSIFSLHNVKCWVGCQERNGICSQWGSLDLIEARNKSGKYTVLRPTFHSCRSAELSQYTKIGLNFVFIRDLTSYLIKVNYEWLLEFDVSETERAKCQCLA